MLASVRVICPGRAQHVPVSRAGLEPRVIRMQVSGSWREG